MAEKYFAASNGVAIIRILDDGTLSIVLGRNLYEEGALQVDIRPEDKVMSADASVDTAETFINDVKAALLK